MRTVIFGAGGQARIVYEILLYQNVYVEAFVDSFDHKNGERLKGLPVLNHLAVPDLMSKGVGKAIIAIGDNKARARLYGIAVYYGLNFISAIHPSALIAPSVKLGCGITIIMGAMVNTGSVIGDDVIINTGAIIDHNCVIGNHAHIGPGAVLAGKVTVGEGTWVGMGVSVKECVTIGSHSIIGAGAVVLEDIPDNVVAVGVPAKARKSNVER